MSSLSVRLPDDLDRRLEAEAQRDRTSRSELAREAIAELLRRRERERFLSELVAEARQITEEGEGEYLVEDQLLVDNEAMEIAEGAPEDPGSERWWR